MAAVRPERRTRPAPLQKELENLEVARHPVTMDGIKEQYVAIRREAAVLVQQFGLGFGKERFARCNSTPIAGRYGSQTLKVKRVYEIFDPPKP